jgi:hypothetical protein
VRAGAGTPLSSELVHLVASGSRPESTERQRCHADCAECQGCQPLSWPEHELSSLDAPVIGQLKKPR